VSEIGIEMALELFDTTIETEKNGGLLVKYGNRRRTPGGVFFKHLHESKQITDEIKVNFKFALTSLIHSIFRRRSTNSVVNTQPTKRRRQNHHFNRIKFPSSGQIIVYYLLLLCHAGNKLFNSFLL
jgi:hypothetical protein